MTNDEAAMSVGLWQCRICGAFCVPIWLTMPDGQERPVCRRHVLPVLVFGERLASPEAREAMTAFFEKRKPDFSRF